MPIKLRWPITGSPEVSGGISPIRSCHCETTRLRTTRSGLKSGRSGPNTRVLAVSRPCALTSLALYSSCASDSWVGTTLVPIQAQSAPSVFR